MLTIRFGCGCGFTPIGEAPSKLGHSFDVHGTVRPDDAARARVARAVSRSLRQEAS
jgi:hypothetical protein